MKSRIFNGWLGTYFILCCTFQLVYACHCWFTLLSTTVWQHSPLRFSDSWMLIFNKQDKEIRWRNCSVSCFFIPFVSIGPLQLFVNMAMYSLSQCRMSNFHAWWVENEVEVWRERGKHTYGEYIFLILCSFFITPVVIQFFSSSSECRQ